VASLKLHPFELFFVNQLLLFAKKPRSKVIFIVALIRILIQDQIKNATCIMKHNGMLFIFEEMATFGSKLSIKLEV
jgi:hypothetical protein